MEILKILNIEILKIWLITYSCRTAHGIKLQYKKYSNNDFLTRFQWGFPVVVIFSQLQLELNVINNSEEF